MNEKERMAEYTIGYRDGYLYGFQEGMGMGRSQGWDNAKWRAFESLKADDVKAALTEYLTKPEVEK